MSLLEDKFLKNLAYIAGVAIAFAVIQVNRNNITRKLAFWVSDQYGLKL